MSLRAAYSTFYTPVFNTSGEFTGKVDLNVPGDLYVGNNTTTYKIYSNGVELSGGSGGGGGDPSTWYLYPVLTGGRLNVNGQPTEGITNINTMPLYVPANNSNIFCAGYNAGSNVNSASVITMVAFGCNAARYNEGDHVFAFGSNAGSYNSGNGNNVFVAGLNAGYSNGGRNLVAIGTGAGYSNVSGDVVAIGLSAGAFNQNSSVVAIGTGAGYGNLGQSCVFLGSNPNISVVNNASHRFVVYSTQASEPLLFGDTQNRRLYINTSAASFNLEQNQNKLIVGGSTYIANDLTVAQTITVSQGSTLRGTTNLYGTTTFYSNVNATVGLTASTLSAGATTLSSAAVQGALNVSGIATVSGAVVQNRLGVGLTAPVQTVDIAGTVGIQQGPAPNASGYLRLANQSNVNYIQSGLSSGTGSSAPLVFGTVNNTAQWMTISGGRVAIGTTNPSFDLHINASNYPEIALTETTTSNYFSFLRDRFSNKSLIRSTTRIDVEIPANSPKVTVLSNGNVGIGRTNPEKTLDVTGTFRATTGDQCLVENSDGMQFFFHASGTDRVRLGAYRGGYTNLTLNEGGGTVGIGTSTPSSNYRLDVAGPTRITSTLDVDSNVKGSKFFNQSASYGFSGTSDVNKWFKVAQFSGNFDGEFLISWYASGEHGDIKFLASTHYNAEPTLTILRASNFGGPAIAQIRMSLDNSNIFGEGFIEVLINTSIFIPSENVAFSIMLENSSSSGPITVFTTKTAGTTTGYTYYALPANIASGINRNNGTMTFDRYGNLAVSGTISGRGSFVYGQIILWYGSVASIPTGWVLCNGNNGTPDLTDRFVLGAGRSYNPNGTGGSTTATANYGTNCWASGVCTGASLLFSPQTISLPLPPFYTLCYIMYVG